MPRRTDNLYRTHGDEVEFLARHPLPNSLIVDATQNRAKNTSTSTPSNKGGRKLDLMGKKQYSLASFSLHTTNHLCAMEAYSRHLLLEMLPVFEQLPDDAKAKLSAYHAELLTLLDYQTIASCHIADTSARQLANAVFLCRHAWLRTVTITDDAHNRIEGAPFDGEGLFAATTGESLDNILKMRKTARSYAFQGSVPSNSVPVASSLSVLSSAQQSVEQATIPDSVILLIKSTAAISITTICTSIRQEAEACLLTLLPLQQYH
ncbi:hypothetical protein JRQ81_000304 [Phrynocephalus forsythii]|uniref:Uncharacterized protein n=1 Tax=Phrynocephalus forsythii TaxID=171643 RepID=A0A9Q1B7X7_9SAUR|nr:hypothetical protein JRQ81_000304 [Phrynocephalus forsythii]